jgi:hypothetical protein
MRESSTRSRSNVERLEDVGKRMQTIGAGMTSVGRGMTLGLTLPIVGAGVAAVKAASDLEETMNKVNVVFGEGAGEVQAWAETASTSFGLSRQQALDAAGTFGTMFEAMDVGRDTSVDMARSLTQLAGDVSSFNNLIMTESSPLRSAMVGEFEPMKSIGVMPSRDGRRQGNGVGLVDLSVDMTKVEGLTLDLEKAQPRRRAGDRQVGRGEHAGPRRGPEAGRDPGASQRGHPGGSGGAYASAAGPGDLRPDHGADNGPAG